MLTQNFQTERGLINNSFSTIINIIWDADVNPIQTISFILLVYCNNYDGPALLDIEQKIVPIFPVQYNFELNRQICNRSQFPIILAYAIIIYKSQNITLDKVRLNLLAKDFTPGLTYIAVSRVKTFGGLLFESVFDFSVFSTSLTFMILDRRVDTEKKA